MSFLKGNAFKISARAPLSTRVIGATTCLPTNHSHTRRRIYTEAYARTRSYKAQPVTCSWRNGFDCTPSQFSVCARARSMYTRRWCSSVAEKSAPSNNTVQATKAGRSTKTLKSNKAEGTVISRGSSGVGLTEETINIASIKTPKDFMRASVQSRTRAQAETHTNKEATTKRATQTQDTHAQASTQRQTQVNQSKTDNATNVKTNTQSSGTANSNAGGNVTTTSTPTPKLTLWQKVKHEAEHYYTGFKLFFIDVRICARYLNQSFQGETLTRRQRRQLVRTTGDIFRLVPFSVFIIVPFMEFLLPVALKLFPGMLPSTFGTKGTRNEANLQQLKVKLEMAKFLQDTVEDLAKKSSCKKQDDGSVSNLADLMARMRNPDTEDNVSVDELLKFSKLFEDELTLDNLDRPQLVALCRMLNLNTYGTISLLRFQLRTCLRQLSADDVMITKEGIDTLTVGELQYACAERGMRSMGLPLSRLQHQLEQWIELNKAGVPASLILLSRTLYLNGDVDKTALKDTLSNLSDNLVGEASLKLSQTAISNKQRLKILKEEESILRQEELEMEREKEEQDLKRKQKEKKSEMAREVLLQSERETREVIEPAMAVEASINLDTVSRAMLQENERSTQKEQEEFSISRADLATLAEAIHVLTAPRRGQVREELAELINDKSQGLQHPPPNVVADHILPTLSPDTASDLVKSNEPEDVEDVEVQPEGEERVIIDGQDHTAKVAQALEKKLQKMMAEMEDEWTKVEATIAKKQLFNDEKVEEEKDVDAFLTLEQIINMGSGVVHSEDASRIEKIVKILDLDGDGIVTVEEIRNVFKRLNEEGTDITPGDLARVVQLVHLEGLNNMAKGLAEHPEDTTQRITEDIRSASDTSTRKT